MDTVTILALVGAAVLAISITLIYAGDFDWYFAALTMGTYLLGSWLVVAKLKGYPHQRFGPANTITALRGGLTCLMAGFLVETEWLIDPTMTSWIWGVVAGSLLALCLDGLDGYLARRFEMTSEFGARYDMEVDAALILCLSLLIYAMAKADWWVIFIGAMRYLFVAAQFFDSRLKRPLQPSLRRKAICVLQMVALCTILLPTVNPPVSTSIAAWALLALVCSFGSDAYSLMRRQARPLTMTKRGASNADLPVSSPITAKMPRETLAPAPGSKVV
ncbi:CDP-alcohol phosphatidyltransferase family protein [Phyllobacterium lublinensis]|uniref:CDP-alcohol phosphatidyltransferase family protein n=1 Tax=Phyllobacterium lublinensis TaxID=2875708 RepID=UPI001CCDD5C3|nr:CDP-alcohol phosphatidyltransferase family protein [Phyllobacterium sp. 2063]MBZ9655453.1 CDP-alcohol phosphatidyltransferase family protein [Phyllobacterium sp. 2063]